MINELQVTADQTRWKFNALLKKYKECIDNNSKSGRNPMTFAYFNEMQDMFGHRQNINCNHVIGSSFFESERQSSSFVESNQQISSEVKRKHVSSSTSESLPAKISKMECQQSLNTAPFETQPSEASSSKTPLSEISPFLSETSSSEKRKKSRAGSATHVANTKLELEKQWLEYVKILADKSQKENEKIKKIDEKLQLKEKQLLWKEMVVNRKMQKKEERHRERMKIENEKCQLLKQLIDSQDSFSVNKMLSFKK